MDPDSNVLAYLLLLLLLVFINAFFAMSEIAVITLNDNKLKRLAESGHRQAKIILSLTREPSKFLATIQVGVTLSGFLASAVAADRFAGLLSSFLIPRLPEPISPSFIHAASLAVITIFLSYFSLVFGELVPKRIAMSHEEKISFFIAPILRFLFIVSKPFVCLLSMSTNAIAKLFGVSVTKQPENVTEEEIRMIVDVGNEHGIIEESEKNMINNILEFDDRTAEEIMTHRTEVTAVQESQTVAEAIELAVEKGYSRMPVYAEDIDNIVGMIYAKDLLRLAGNPESLLNSVHAYMRPAFFIPESNRCDELLNSFKERKIQVAVVVDEYGGTSGIVTMEDLLETIVGNIQDEYDDEEEIFSKTSDNSYILDGSISPDKFQKLLNINIENDKNYDTLGGFLTDILDRIPGKDEHPVVVYNSVKFTVLRMEERRIAKVRAEFLPKKLSPPQ